MEQVKVFTSKCFYDVYDKDPDPSWNHVGIEPLVNKWLKENDGKIEVTGRTFNVHAVEVLPGKKDQEYIICIFYKEVN